MCKILGVNKSTLYNQFNKVNSKRKIDQSYRDKQILDIYFEHKRIYWTPKTTYIMNSLRHKVSQKRVSNTKWKIIII